MPDAIADNLKPIGGAVLFLIGLGMGWNEWTTRLNQKADRVEVEALARAIQATSAQVEIDKRVTRILLCRMPEIRPDSHCTDYR